MRNSARAAIIAVVLAIIASNVANAADYITDAATALKQSRVYVAPGTENTDGSTTLQLGAALTGTDKIVLVMLPASAEKDLGVDINSIATSLSDKLENKYIIGLAVGNKVVEYAPTLPSGVSSDQMRRAKNVSNNNPVTILTTYALNIQGWLKQNRDPIKLTPTPKPTPIPKPTPTPKQIAQHKKTQTQHREIAAVLGVIVLAIAAIIGHAVYRQQQLASPNRTHFNAHEEVNDQLSKIAHERGQINDFQFSKAMQQMCVDIEQLFGPISKDKQRDARLLRDPLNDVANVLAKYVDIQNNPRYYRSPEADMARGKESAISFAQSVLDSIQNYNEAAMMGFRVDTTVLKAQKRS